MTCLLAGWLDNPMHRAGTVGLQRNAATLPLASSHLERGAAAPSLRCLILSGSPSLHGVAALQPLASYQTLEELRIESFDERLASEVSSRYGWKVAYCNIPAEEYL
jgi:hypothetical protein